MTSLMSVASIGILTRTLDPLSPTMEHVKVDRGSSLEDAPHCGS